MEGLVALEQEIIRRLHYMKEVLGEGSKQEEGTLATSPELAGVLYMAKDFMGALKEGGGGGIDKQFNQILGMQRTVRHRLEQEGLQDVEYTMQLLVKLLVVATDIHL